MSPGPSMADMGIHLAVSRLGTTPTMDLMRTLENIRARLSGDPNAGNNTPFPCNFSIPPLNTHLINKHPLNIHFFNTQYTFLTYTLSTHPLNTHTHSTYTFSIHTFSLHTFSIHTLSIHTLSILLSLHLHYSC